MEQDIGSIMKFLYNQKNCEVITQKLPEGFNNDVASLYFPLPTTVDGSESDITHYSIGYSLPIKVFNPINEDAYAHATLLANVIRNKRNLIPIVDIDGVPVVPNQYVRIRGIEVRMIDEGTALLSLNWNTLYSYDIENVYDKVDSFYLSSSIK